MKTMKLKGLIKLSGISGMANKKQKSNKKIN